MAPPIYIDDASPVPNRESKTKPYQAYAYSMAFLRFMDTISRLGRNRNKRHHPNDPAGGGPEPMVDGLADGGTPKHAQEDDDGAPPSSSNNNVTALSDLTTTFSNTSSSASRRKRNCSATGAPSSSASPGTASSPTPASAAAMPVATEKRFAGSNVRD